MKEDLNPLDTPIPVLPVIEEKLIGIVFSPQMAYEAYMKSFPPTHGFNAPPTTPYNEIAQVYKDAWMAVNKCYAAQAQQQFREMAITILSRKDSK